MNTWKGILNELAFTPIQKFSYTTGKTLPIVVLIIDAMDIWDYELVDGFWYRFERQRLHGPC